MEQLPPRIGKSLASAILVFCSVLLVVLLSRGQTIYALVVTLSMISCLAWLLRRAQSPRNDDDSTPRRVRLSLGLLFFAVLLASIVVYVIRDNQYERPDSWFFLVAVLIGLVAVQIVTSRHRDGFGWLIVAQVIAIGLLLTVSMQFMYPDVVGIDSAWYRMFTKAIVEAGRLPDGFRYSSFPAFSFETIAIMLTAEVEYKSALLMGTSCMQTIGNTLFVFILSRRLFSDDRIGLMAGLLLVSANYSVQFSWWATPTTFSSIFILPLCYVAVARHIESRSVRVPLFVTFMIAVISGHALVSICALLVILVMWGSSFMQRRMTDTDPADAVVRSHYPLLFFVCILAWWLSSIGVLDTLLDTLLWGLDIDASHGGGVNQSLYTGASIIYSIASNSGLMLFFSLSIYGGLYMVGLRGAPSGLAVSGFIVLAISFLALASSREILNVRWAYFAQILLAIPLSVTILHLVTAFGGHNMRMASAFSFAWFLGFLMIASPVANFDSDILAPDDPARLAFSGSEFNAASFLVEFGVGSIASDFDYCTNPSSSVFLNYFGLSYSMTVSLDSALETGDFSSVGGVVVLRSEIASGLFRTAGGAAILDYDPILYLSHNQNFDMFYDCGSVRAFVQL